MIQINTKEQDFIKLMNLYEKAQEQLLEELNSLKAEMKFDNGYDVIKNITSRIKTPKSIINKMKKKRYELNYKNLIKNINDIAGIRITCMFQNDIKQIVKAIRKMPNIIVIKEKDYIRKPKKSGYSAYHLIVKIPVEVQGQKLFIKAEIQIRTMAMDLWSSAEHAIKYKPQKRLSVIDSKKLSLYAKLINHIEIKIMKLYYKQIKSE